MTPISYKLALPAASGLPLKHRSTEGNTLTGLIYLLRSAIEQKRTVHRLFCIVTVVLASATAASAQRDSQRPTLPAVKGVSPPVQEDVPVAPPNAPATVRLQFPNSDVVDVLHLYEQLTGKKLVMDNFVQGKVNIFISKDVPREEAIKIIQINLLMNGFSLVPADEDIVKVIGTGKNPRTTGVPIISDPSDIPVADQVISYLFKLR